MATLINRILEWSKRTDKIIDKDWYAIGLFVLVLAGFCLQLPFILNVIIQACFLVCTLHLTYWYIRHGQYLLAVLKVGLIVAVGLLDDIYFHIIFSN